MGKGSQKNRMLIIDGARKYECYSKPPPFVSQTNELEIKFKINQQSIFSGYNATYRTVSKYPVCCILITRK